jgi:cell division protein FtsW
MAEKKATSKGFDLGIVIPVLCLMLLSLVTVYSASSHLALHELGDSYYYLKRQALFCLAGLVLLYGVKKFPCSLYARLVYPLLLGSGVLLGLLLVPGVGSKVGGAVRWIRIGGISFQPSEFAKIALAVYLAYSMAKKGEAMGTFATGLLPHLLVTGIFIGLITLQPDLGTAMILGCWSLTLLFIGGASVLQLMVIMLFSSPVLLWLIQRTPYRLDRWNAFLNPWDDPQGIGFQIIHSFLAFGSGGILGAGLGDSKQKLFYLPEPHTDFILSIIGEEMGLIGVAAIVALFGFLIVRGIRVALNAPDLYSTYLAFGVTCLIGIQAVVNMGVVMGLLPTKGLTLPLISYGGSSLMVTLFSVGVLLNISSKA